MFSHIHMTTFPFSEKIQEPFLIHIFTFSSSSDYSPVPTIEKRKETCRVGSIIYDQSSRMIDMKYERDNL